MSTDTQNLSLYGGKNGLRKYQKHQFGKVGVKATPSDFRVRYSLRKKPVFNRKQSSGGRNWNAFDVCMMNEFSNICMEKFVKNRLQATFESL